MTDTSQVAKDLLEYLEGVKEKLAADFEALGLGKDQLLQVHNAIDSTHAVIASAGPVEGYDLNVDLAENPEDHPAPQGQESTPINLDPNVNQASPVDPAQPVVSGAPTDAVPPDDASDTAPDDPEHRVGPEGEPHAPQAG